MFLKVSIILFTLAAALHAEDAKPCFSGQGPLEPKQERCFLIAAHRISEIPNLENYVGMMFVVTSAPGNDWHDLAKDAKVVCQAAKNQCSVMEVWADGKLLARIDANGKFHAYAPAKEVAAAIMAAVGRHE